jgi:hypothetical protein
MTENNGFPTAQTVLEVFPSEAAIHKRLDVRFHCIEIRLDPEDKATLDYLLTATAHEWEQSIVVMQSSYQKLLAKLKENCAKAVCPMCKTGDPRFEHNGHEVHQVEGNLTARCGANSIWSMK